MIGRYFAGESCLLLSARPARVPDEPRARRSATRRIPTSRTGIWIPDGNGGVTLRVGNDGGFYKQHADAGQELDNGRWGDGNQDGFHTLLPYDVAMANDGTVWAGLQDNGHMKIDPRRASSSRRTAATALRRGRPRPTRDVAYEEYVYGEMRVTTDGGKTWTDMFPPLTNPRFVNPFEMDPTDAKHLVTGGNEIVETIYGPETTGKTEPPLVGDPTPGGLLTECCGDKPWTQVFDLGTRKQPGDATATPSADDPANGMSAIDVHGDAVYVGYCGVCSILNQSQPFQSGIATNVGGVLPPKRTTSNGWHIAEARGLPERFITSVAIDPADATKKTIYVTLGGYSMRWVPPGTLQDKSSSVGAGHLYRSTDGGETFTDISGNLPDVPATWVTLRGKQLIVGTDVGVFATGDEGRHDLRLPQGPAGRPDQRDEPQAGRPEPARGRHVRPRHLDVLLHDAAERHGGRLPDRAARPAGAADAADRRDARRPVRLRAGRPGLVGRVERGPRWAHAVEAQQPVRRERVDDELRGGPVRPAVVHDFDVAAADGARRLALRRLHAPHQLRAGRLRL